MSIVDTPENDLSNCEDKSYMRKVRTSSVESSSTRFLCSIHAIYNRVNSAKNNVSCWNHTPQVIIHWLVQRDIITFSSEKLVNKFYNCIEKHPHVIQSQSFSGSTFFKVNGTLLNKHNHLIQISVQDLHNDIILPVSQVFLCTKWGWQSMYWR